MSEELTKDQQRAFELITEWLDKYEKSSSKQVFVLQGYAGTGKSYLIDKIIKSYDIDEDDVIFATFTGKAASLLSQKGLNVSTIHHLIYVPYEVKYTELVNGSPVVRKEMKFAKRQYLEKHYKLIVIDEVSMVDNKMFEDLKSFGIPLLVVGDSGQLPPVDGKSDILNKPDAVLEEIVRQASDNEIIMMSVKARHNEPIPYGDFGDVVVLNRDFIPTSEYQDLLLNADQIICGTNKTRRKLNNYVRQLKGIDIEKDRLPCVGEKVICVENDWEFYLDKERKYNLVNGTIGSVASGEFVNYPSYLDKITFTPAFLNEPTEEILYDTGIFDEMDFHYESGDNCIITPNGLDYLKKSMDYRDKEAHKKYTEKMLKKLGTVKIHRFEFAYCISCHKSQGSEFDTVVLFDESKMFRDQASKWLYTGITRAKKKLYIIK